MDRPSLSAPPRIMGDHPYEGMPSRAVTRVRRKPKTLTVEAPAAGPSHMRCSPSVDSTEADDTFPQDMGLLERMMDGRGLSDDQWDGLVLQCDECGQRFLRSKLSDHRKRCKGLILL
ncbi:hypothetical protein BDZ97DRAFT_74931 [Flammula alnicola]|nr:hypothetical protein BDZ97DRAFT_74931 [Flammula alnicola]